MPRGVCVMGVKGALTSPEQSRSGGGGSSVYDSGTFAEPAHLIADQQGETVDPDVIGHYYFCLVFANIMLYCCNDVYRVIPSKEATDINPL